VAAKCPACGYRRRRKDDALYPDWQCPQCKRAYAKVELRDLRQGFAARGGVPSPSGASGFPGRIVTTRGGGAVREAEAPGALLLLIPVAAAGLLGYWMLGGTLIGGTAWKVGGATGVTILATSLVSAFDAKRLTMGSKHDVTANRRRRPGPIFWFLFELLFWPVAYPTYLYWRSRYGARNLAVIGVAIVLGFGGMVAMAGKEMLPGSHSGASRYQGSGRSDVPYAAREWERRPSVAEASQAAKTGERSSQQSPDPLSGTT
jgi:hypothetical protein